MSDDKPKSKARVRFTVEYADAGTWGKDCPIGQVWDQAKAAALASFDALLKEHGPKGYCFTLVGEPEVLSIIVPEPRK